MDKRLARDVTGEPSKGRTTRLQKQNAVAIGALVITLGLGVTTLSEVPAPVKGHPTAVLSSDMVRAKARIMYGKDEIRWKCLDTLWTIESHWDYKATGARTTRGMALGIAQALPASKMKVSGLDYKSNPITQVKWGLKYIKSRYNNNACLALRHELDRGWY